MSIINVDFSNVDSSYIGKNAWIPLTELFQPLPFGCIARVAHAMSWACIFNRKKINILTWLPWCKKKALKNAHFWIIVLVKVCLGKVVQCHFMTCQWMQANKTWCCWFYLKRCLGIESIFSTNLPIWNKFLTCSWGNGCMDGIGQNVNFKNQCYVLSLWATIVIYKTHMMIR